MKKVFVDEMIVWVIQAKQVLEEADIPCFLKNEFSSSAAGEVPLNEVWPELWVHRDSDFDQAKELLKPLRASRMASGDEAAELPEWTCPQCQEVNEGNFAICWSCGVAIDAA